MSVEAMALALHHSRARGTAKLVLLGIANHEGDGGAWPALTTLARYAGCSVRQAQRALRQLEALGELTTARQAGGLGDLLDAERPNLYRVSLACPPDCDRTASHRTRQSRLAFPVDNRVSPAPSPPVDNRVTLVSPGDTGVTGGGDMGVTRTTQGTIHQKHSSPPAQGDTSARTTAQPVDTVDNPPPARRPPSPEVKALIEQTRAELAAKASPSERTTR